MTGTAVCWECQAPLSAEHSIGVCHVKMREPGESGEKNGWRCDCGAVTFTEMTFEEFQARLDERQAKYRVRKAEREAASCE